MDVIIEGCQTKQRKAAIDIKEIVVNQISQ
jgi:hypothetical protein